jgi:tRNA(Ile)-lysidine synthase
MRTEKMNLEDRVRRTIHRRALAGPETAVVSALSGGSDSVALAHLLKALSLAGDLRLVALAHFNHRLRPEGDAEQDFCAGIARALNLPFLVDGADVRALARREHRSLEDSARTARHGFLERARRSAGADVIALGHTRDDQAETFLLRLLRGAGSRGLASMHPRNGPIVRPLLDCRRDQLMDYLDSRDIPFVEDSSNADVGIPRNRVRAELLPLLKERFNPAVVDALADAADIAREEWKWLDEAAQQLERRISRRDGAQVLIDSAALGSAPTAIARAALHRMMAAASNGRTIGFDAIDRAVELSRGSGSSFDAPGQRLQRIGADIVLTGRAAGATGRPQLADRGVSQFRYPLSIPGEVQLPEVGCVVSAEEVTVAPSGAIARSRGMVVVPRDLCGTALAVRNRRPWDRFRPAGVEGHKKLQDFFVDRKVAQRLRDRVPLVVDETDRIVWVAGHAANDEFRVTDPAQAVIILRLKGVGGAV